MADYVRMSRAFAASSAVDVSRGAGGKIAATARVTRSILWDDVHVEDGCTLDECIVTDGVRIPAGASYNRVALVRPRGSRDLDELLIAPITE
jgi:ADP-glucose pyrophosphorylase